MVELRDIMVRFGDTIVLKNFNLKIEPGEHIALMGPSGAGKTTILKLISKQISPHSGNISVNTSRISYMFQEPRLLPWLTAAENVNLVLGDRPASLPEAKKWLTRFGLGDAVHKYPHELSGGMKQRVALARALAYNGDLLLLDEPLSALDEGYALETLNLIKEYTEGKTVVLVTHNSNHAKEFADKIYVIKKQSS